jgi:hypothetical protein
LLASVSNALSKTEGREAVSEAKQFELVNDYTFLKPRLSLLKAQVSSV